MRSPERLLLIAIICLALPWVGVEAETQTPTEPTWTERATVVITHLRGEEPTVRQVELMCDAVWFASQGERDATTEQRAQYTVQAMAQWLNQEIDKGAQRQGILQLRKQ